MIRPIILAAVMATIAAPVAAITRTDPANDYLSTYTGPKNGDLDVLTYSASIVGSNFLLSSTVGAAPGTTANGIYVWGVDRGAGTAGFGVSLGLTGVLFDSVVILRPNGTGTVNLLNGTTFAITSTIVGNTISALVPIADLPSRGFTVNHYTFNLWPRLNGGPVANIADFAPDNATIRAVPEPTSWALFVAGFGVIGGAMRRRAKAVAA